MRTKFVAGNWKMYKTPSEAESLAKDLKERFSKPGRADIVVCPPFTALDRVSRVLSGTQLRLGAQDMHWEDQGAFTGKVSHDMLKDIGVQYVIIGHSEQRTYFHETNETVCKKTRKALETGLVPIVCVGETLEQREANKTEAIVQSHIEGAFQGLAKDLALGAIVAYEPVWAIGTGKTATPAQAQEVHAFIRDLVKKLYDADFSQQLRILYGGSVKPGNAAELFGLPDVDGGLIGGASLKGEDFAGIVAAAN
ncbi:MAG: triose-phosphate isomerase [Spirochaetales bacterium]|nr:triose-phosphate isomerase [Leptospiraceae bacterium]MCP5482238.1 triose-phosphate isomerase [Spirochaetales bacterium]MCP5484650.1 triose-phosphate isomerase [Spirochaetales bacterium]